VGKILDPPPNFFDPKKNENEMVLGKVLGKELHKIFCGNSILTPPMSVRDFLYAANKHINIFLVFLISSISCALPRGWGKKKPPTLLTLLVSKQKEKKFSTYHQTIDSE
jgi:hypothetical protein